MNATWEYLRYILAHKWNFIKANRIGRFRLGLRVLLHDLSKFSPAEFRAYRDKFYGPEGLRKTPEVRQKFDLAWAHHIQHNPHHWEHWCLVSNVSGCQPLPMPDMRVREMLCDWLAMSKGNLLNMKLWYKKNGYRFQMHPHTRTLVEDWFGITYDREAE